MFSLHRNRSSAKSGERIDFKFSNFLATQVPKHWDRLFISIVSLETGKTLAKSGKALVRNGSCQWIETLSESIWMSYDDTSKEPEECLFKFMVSMGYTKSGILGEVIINMTDYIKSHTSAPITVPLRKCAYGTTLQIKIQCLTPKTKQRHEKSSLDSNSVMEVFDTDSPDMEVGSDASDSTFAKSVGSSSSNNLDSTSHLGELGKTSLCASRSRPSFESADSSVESTNVSPKNNLNGNFNDAHIRSNPSSYKTRVTESESHSKNHRRADSTSSLKDAGSSRKLLESAENRVEDLRAEAKMWEKNARKLMLDLDLLRKEYLDQTKIQENMDMELSAIYTERDELKKEIEELKFSLDESLIKQTVKEEPTFDAQGSSQYTKELENEIKFQKDSIDSLTLQLKKNQESNIELVSVLQEFEETIEKQKSEIENLSATETKFNNIEETLEIRTRELEKERRLNNQSLLNIETEYKRKLSDKEKELAILEAKLSEDLEEIHKEEKVLIDQRNEIVYLSADLESKDEEIRALQQSQKQLEAQLSDLQLEKIQMEKNIEAMERARCLVDLSKSSELDSEKHKLEGEIIRLGVEMETQKGEFIQKLENSQSRLSEAQEECEYLKRPNSNYESLIEESSSFQKSNERLKKQNLELKGYCTKLEDELNESRSSIVIFSRRINILEENISSVLKDFAAKERNIIKEMDALIVENQNYILEETLLNTKYLDKTVEVESLQVELKRLNHEFSASQDAAHEASILHEDKLQGMMNELKASKQNQEMLKAGNEELSKVLENYKSSEEKLNSVIDDFEIKLAASEYERKQLTEEGARLKIKVQSLENMQDEILALKNELNDMKFEKEKSEASCENLKEEKITFLETISTLQKAVSDFSKADIKVTSMDQDMKHSKDDNGHDLTKLKAEEEIVPKERYERTKSSLQAELRDLQDRYFNMSLKYAEVEAEREELVMKLKGGSTKSGKGWFS